MKSGYFRAIHRGVYLVGPVEPARAMEMAAVLAGGPSTALSHTSALWLLELVPGESPRPIHVTVPFGGRRARTGIRFHRSVRLTETECSVVDGIRVTTPLRTIVDAADLLGHREMEQVLATAEREEVVTRRDLLSLPDRYPRRAGTAVLRKLLRDGTEPRFTRSEAERRCLELLHEAGLPRPKTNVNVGPYELDLYWPSERLAIEIDGRKHHASRPRFEGDRRKDAWLRAQDIEVLRLGWRQITRDAMVTAVQVGQALALARRRRMEGDGAGVRAHAELR